MKGLKLYAWGLLVLGYVILAWPDHPLLAIVFGTNGIIPFMHGVFETKKIL